MCDFVFMMHGHANEAVRLEALGDERDARDRDLLRPLSLGLGVTAASAATHPYAATKGSSSGCAATRSAAIEPSRQLPPRSLRGYALVYCEDFRGSQLPRGWFKFDGVPGGDPSGMFLPSHVKVAGGLLRLNTYRDAEANHNWATGGVCQCGLARTYGAYFVRSRGTSAATTTSSCSGRPRTSGLPRSTSTRPARAR